LPLFSLAKQEQLNSYVVRQSRTHCIFFCPFFLFEFYSPPQADKRLYLLVVWRCHSLIFLSLFSSQLCCVVFFIATGRNNFLPLFFFVVPLALQFLPLFSFSFLPLFSSAVGSRFVLFVATYKRIFTSITDILFYSKAVNFLPLFSLAKQEQLNFYVVRQSRTHCIFFAPFFF